MRTLLDLMQAAPSGGVQLASLGQRYQNYPAATFDERFGPYNIGPMSDPAILRQFLQPRDPEMIVPGSRAWPSGFIRSEAPAPTLMQLAENTPRRANPRPVLSEQQKAIMTDLLDPAKWEPFLAAMRERDRQKQTAGE